MAKYMFIFIRCSNFPQMRYHNAEYLEDSLLRMLRTARAFCTAVAEKN
jgi:hypothetical protein